MSRNVKPAFDQGTRTGNRNNINIQINFNVKDKNPAISGKRIDNYVEIQQKNNSKVDSYTRNTEQSKKMKKKQNESNNKIQKQKLVDTPMKHRHIETNKIVKRNNSKTPEKIEVSRKEERSKSTNRKLVKRKNAKSVQNLRAGYRYTQNKGISPRSSNEKQKSRSHSKSSKKVIKSTQQSMKNLHVFSNTGIKNKINNTKHNISRQRVSSAASKRHTRQQDHQKIKKFMDEKKRKQKNEDRKKAKQNKLKKERIQQELKKVEAERKANASKPIHIPKDLFGERREKLPLNFSSEDEFQQSLEYERHNKEASDLIHQSPPREDPMQSISMEKFKKMEHFASSSGKKTKKTKKGQLVYRYLNGSITSKQMKELDLCVRNIQRCWRGYISRKEFALKLSDESTKYRYIKNKFENKRDIFWSNQDDNSIVNVDKQSTIRVYDSGSSSLNIGNFHSNPGSDHSHNLSDQKNKTDRFKKLSINLIEDEQFQGSKERSEKQTYQNSKMLRQIQQLRKMLDQQNMKYRSLEQQNENLKANIEKMSLKHSRQSRNNSQELGNSIDKIEIRMPKKIESPPNQIKNDEQLKQQQQKHEKKKLVIESDGHFDVQTFKQQFQAFDCSSPSNSKIEEQLRQLRSKNVESILSKKEVKLSKKYEKKVSMFDKMLQDKIVSPRTYNMKKKEIEERLKTEKLQLKQKFQEAKNVLGYFQDLSSEESEQEKKDKMSESQQLRTSNIGERQPNFKKDKTLKDSEVNTDPIQMQVQEIKPCEKESQQNVHHSENKSHSSYSSEDDRVYKKYWTDDIQQVHKHTLQITKKIEEALKAESQSSSKRQETQKQQYSSSEANRQQGYRSYDSSKQQIRQSQEQMAPLTHIRSKSSDININLDTIEMGEEDDYMQELREMPSESQKKARQIFNKINVFDGIDCNSDEQMENDSHTKLIQVLNQQPVSPENNKKPQNLYVSEAQFNQKKRKQEELSRSSSFQKSNKSLSINNSSHLDLKGFITNLTFIKQFCISICQFIRSNDTWKSGFIDEISKPTGINLSELLRAYRITIGGEVKNNYNTFTDQYIYPYFKNVSDKNPIINQELFTDFLKAFDQQRGSNQAWNQTTMSKKTKQMRQFFLISIIDTFNEALEFQKPGSVYGEPIPWLNHYKHLKNHNTTTLKFASTEKRYESGTSSNEEQSQEERRLDQIFGTSIAKVIQWGSCLCGFIADPMPMEMGDSQIANLSDQQLNSIRENRVGLMLEKWLLEQEQQMTNSTPEYTEAILCLTQKIYESLILQATGQLQDILYTNEQ